MLDNIKRCFISIWHSSIKGDSSDACFCKSKIKAMDNPPNNHEFYRVFNDDKLLSEFARHQNLTQKSENHFCHCGASMLQERKHKDGTVKVYPTIRCTNRECRNRLNIRPFYFTDALGRSNSKLDMRTILELTWLWYLGASSSTVATLLHVTEPTIVHWTNFLREESFWRFSGVYIWGAF